MAHDTALRRSWEHVLKVVGVQLGFSMSHQSNTFKKYIGLVQKVEQLKSNTFKKYIGLVQKVEQLKVGVSRL